MAAGLLVRILRVEVGVIQKVDSGPHAIPAGAWIGFARGKSGPHVGIKIRFGIAGMAGACRHRAGDGGPLHRGKPAPALNKIRPDEIEPYVAIHLAALHVLWGRTHDPNRFQACSTGRAVRLGKPPPWPGPCGQAARSRCALRTDTAVPAHHCSTG
ncbi:hypothetical protein AA0616_0638 [Komagataeibacter nataicola NRIC 0616]|nr:hypothetical protein AA0616_0638 [Komagataeibacter nataicola NRIC 0616]